MAFRLPEELMIMIWRKYFEMSVLFEIKKIREARLKTIKEHIKVLNSSLKDSDTEIFLNLTDVGDYNGLNRECMEFDKSPLSIVRIAFQSIQNGLEAFYSLSLTEREKLRTKATNYKLDHKYGLFGNDPATEFFSNEYMYIIDNNMKTHCHSGFSFGYCLKIVVLMIMEDESKKLSLWAQNINSYLCKYFTK